MFYGLISVTQLCHSNVKTAIHNTKMNEYSSVLFSSVTQSCPTLCNPMNCSQASLSITNSQSPPKPMSIKWWYHPAISSSVVPFSSCPQSFPASGSFQMSQLFTWGGQRIGASASAWVLPVDTQHWSPLGWISLQSERLSRVQKHHCFGAQLSSQPNSHIHTWALEKPWPWQGRPVLAK